jgi:hypothetical protein
MEWEQSSEHFSDRKQFFITQSNSGYSQQTYHYVIAKDNDTTIVLGNCFMCKQL